MTRVAIAVLLVACGKPAELAALSPGDPAVVKALDAAAAIAK